MTATEQQQAANILIVDDTPANLLLLERMLTERGYTRGQFSAASWRWRRPALNRPT